MPKLIGFKENADLITRLLLAGAVLTGCYFVMAPFLSAIVIAAILVVTTWPVFIKIRNVCRGRNTPAAALMVLALVLIVLLPTTFFLLSAANQLPKGIALLREWTASGFAVPSVIREIPWAGPWLYREIQDAIDPATLGTTLQKVIEPAVTGLIHTAVNLSNAVVQMALVAFCAFFLYKDGHRFVEQARRFLTRVGGSMSQHLADILVQTTRASVYGILGTALAQGLVCGFALWLSGVPGVLFLSLLTAALSVIPIGPPLVWGPAALWLWSQGEPYWALFLAVWGVTVVASVDNVVKTLLIAQGGTLPLALVFLGVLGGVIAFGFLGLILGPVLLSIGLALLQAWLGERAPPSAPR